MENWNKKTRCYREGFRILLFLAISFGVIGSCSSHNKEEEDSLFFLSFLNAKINPASVDSAPGGDPDNTGTSTTTSTATGHTEEDTETGLVLLLLKPEEGSLYSSGSMEIRSNLPLDLPSITGLFGSSCDGPFQIKREQANGCESIIVYSEDGIKIFVQPVNGLEVNSMYTLSAGSLRSVDGRLHSETFAWNFSTAIDETPPTVVAYSGESSGTLDWSDPVFFVEFSEAIDESSIGIDSFFLCDSAIVQSFDGLESGNRRAVFSVNWPESRMECEGKISGSVSDINGNPMGASVSLKIHLGAPSAKLALREVAATRGGASGGDYIELKVQKRGTLSGISILENGEDLITFPDLIPNEGELILLHVNGDGVVPAGTNENKNPDLSSDEGAVSGVYDFWSTDTGLSGTDGLIEVRDIEGIFQDRLAYSNRDGDASVASMRLFSALYQSGAWPFLEDPINDKNDLTSQNLCVRLPNDSERTLSRDTDHTPSGKSGWYDSLPTPGFANDGNENPVILSVLAESPHLLRVQFSEDPEPESLIAAIGSLSGAGDPILGKRTFIEPDSIEFQITSDLQAGEMYTIHFTNWTDLAGLPVPPEGASASFAGYGTPEASLAFSEFMPGGSPDWVELHVRSGGVLNGMKLCHRTTCLSLPDARIVRAGEKILFRAEAGIDDVSIEEGSLAASWEFFHLPSLTSTDSSLKILSQSGELQDAVFFANGTGTDATTWTGCGSGGDASCTEDAILAGIWSLAGIEWTESDAISNDGGSNGATDFFQKCPDEGETGKTGWIFQTDGPAQSTPGVSNNCS